MIILNAMFGKKLGGIEQAFIDYAEALASRGHTVICTTRLNAKINPVVEKLQKLYPQDIIHYRLPNYSKFDPITKFLLLRIVKKHLPDVMVAHGNRPAALLSYVGQKSDVPLVGVVHNYQFKSVMNCNYLFCVSNDIKEKVAAKFFGADKVFRVPNLIRVSCEPAFKPQSQTPKIGVMARFVEKKGVDVFIKALDIINKKGINFVAEIAGDGDLREELQAMRDEYKLNDKVPFTGWVKDKSKFYNDIDIFCLPSLSEPFGIVLLEAMNFKKPIVATNIEGPAEILRHNIDSLMFAKGDFKELAQMLEEAIVNKAKVQNFAEKGYQVVKNVYDLPIVAEALEKTLQEVIRDY